MRKYKILALVILTIFSTSCLNDLDTEPKIEDTLDNLLKKDPTAIDGIVSKIYGTFALTGPSGPKSTDIAADDPGTGAFLRAIINLQDFSADGMKNLWGDDGLDQLTTTSNWNANNKFFRYLYDRAYYTIPQSTNIILALKDSKIPNKDNYISELRFLRALSYYYLIDCFGKGVLVTDENYGKSELFPESSRVELFNYVEKELREVENNISSTKVYGRVNKHVVRTLLAKLYLNAEVYTGTQRYNDALIYAEKVINEGGYSLASNFSLNFSADNDSSPEMIFPLIADAVTSQSFGNTSYIINGSLSNATMNPKDFGSIEAWSGHRATTAWHGLYGDLATSTDVRSKLFWTQGHVPDMDSDSKGIGYKQWIKGYPSIKFTNLRSEGNSEATQFASTDFPLFRLADIYLIYAEAHLRGGGGNDLVALGYVNAVRSRSNANEVTSIDLDFILDERARELNLEGHRRTDLIRFGKFTGGEYKWPWKGNDQNGVAIPDHYKLYPIPFTAIDANSNLKQNPGY